MQHVLHFALRRQLCRLRVARSVHGGEPQLVVAYDDHKLIPMMWLSIGRDRLYLTVRQIESDIWVADVEVRR